MGYTNSPLVSYTKFSPNHSGQRTHAIDRITPHCVVGQCTAEGLGDWFYQLSTQASSNYGIDKNGRVGLYVEEKNRSWCTSSNANDQRAITIECASNTIEPYTMNNAVYETLIKLCTDICKRNGKKKLLWFADKDKSLNYVPKSDEMIITVHRWFANKSCPGNWLYARLGDVASRVTANLGSTVSQTTRTKATVFANLSEADAVKMAGPLFTANQKKTGILASVSMAQFILESGYGKSELAQKANNVFGMKTSLSGNTWSGSTWDGKSKYTKKTQEEYTVGHITTITADFRKYLCIEDSIDDHAAYLLGAKNGFNLRYAGLKGCSDYKKAAQIIKNGGYATSSTYVKNLCSIIEKWKLTQYDVTDSVDTVKTFPTTPFTVKVLIDDLNYRSQPSMSGKVNGQTGIGAFTIVEVKDGWGRLKSGAGWIYLENPSYCTIHGTVQAAPAEPEKNTFPACPFTVKVIIDDLNYRSAPSMEGKVNGQTGKGVFTIMEVKDGWGRLKSGAGWIYLENPSYCTIHGTVQAAPAQPAKKSVDELAKEVIQGKWGNGQARKDALTAAGYDYNAVQARVNQLMK